MNERATNVHGTLALIKVLCRPTSSTWHIYGKVVATLEYIYI